jgi:hypothetical protein
MLVWVLVDCTGFYLELGITMDTYQLYLYG